MALTQYTADTDIIETLGTNPEDRPTLTDNSFKAKFDENSENIKTFLNAMIAELASTAAGKGASQIGIEDSAGRYTATQIEAALAEAATLISTKANSVQEAWIEPTLQNGWVNVESGSAKVGYYKDTLGSVHIKGTIKSGTYTDATILFNLASGYRPTVTYYFLANDGAGYDNICIIIISSDGNVGLYGATSNSMLRFGTISFRV